MFGILEKQAASMCNPASEAMSAQQFMKPTKETLARQQASKLTHQQQSNLCEDQSCKLEDGLLENTSESENY